MPFLSIPAASPSGLGKAMPCHSAAQRLVPKCVAQPQQRQQRRRGPDELEHVEGRLVNCLGVTPRKREE